MPCENGFVADLNAHDFATLSFEILGRVYKTLIADHRLRVRLTGHKTRAVLDRYNIVNEQKLLTAGQRLAAYLAKDS
jgi:hypothetical protein